MLRQTISSKLSCEQIITTPHPLSRQDAPIAALHGSSTPRYTHLDPSSLHSSAVPRIHLSNDSGGTCLCRGMQLPRHSPATGNARPHAFPTLLERRAFQSDARVQASSAGAHIRIHTHRQTHPRRDTHACQQRQCWHSASAQRARLPTGQAARLPPYWCCNSVKMDAGNAVAGGAPVAAPPAAGGIPPCAAGLLDAAIEMRQLLLHVDSACVPRWHVTCVQCCASPKDRVNPRRDPDRQLDIIRTARSEELQDLLLSRRWYTCGSLTSALPNTRLLSLRA
jgi:hypothetical protein